MTDWLKERAAKRKRLKQLLEEVNEILKESDESEDELYTNELPDLPARRDSTVRVGLYRQGVQRESSGGRLGWPDKRQG